ncbi:histidine phosphatase family protein [Streptomyces hirsutus]|uniref:histidine phosphatase family protein n=1 Tax=Streptomyces hirsutus TaxID=35620 RepID=UPI0033ED853D
MPDRRTVALVTLGCARNEVDSEELAGRLEADGWQLVEDAEDADVAVVNTCGFVEAAKKDSVDALLEANDLKGHGRTQAVVAVGCMAERYGKELAEALPEADGVLGFDDYTDISAPADMGPPATFVLLRHGETPLTPQKRFSGSGGSDPSLSDAGREQAERTAAALARRGTVQAVVASPLARTRETAGIVAARLGLEVSVEEGLRETDFGAWEGLTFAEVRERHPDDLNAWLSSPDAEPTGGGESFADTATRVAATRDKLTAAYAGRTVLLVTHVTPIKTLIRLALGAPPEALFRMELSAASLSAVAYYADGNASVRLFNETSHLR